MNHLPTSRSSLFDDLFSGLAPSYVVRPLHGDPLPQQIKLDVKENAENYVVHAELPGVAKGDIHVSVDGPVVAISAEIKQHDQQGSNDRLLRSERYFGSVSRSLRLPVDIDEARAVAKFENGVLALTLPKKAVTQGERRLRID